LGVSASWVGGSRLGGTKQELYDLVPIGCC
jgi:hypothetical protein